MTAGSAAEPVQRLLERRRRELFAPYPKALLGDVEAVHDLRVSARRLRVAAALLAAKPSGKLARRTDRRLKVLARTAGAGRDMDVAAEVLAGFAPAGPRARRDWTSLQRSVTASRARARRRTREDLLDLDVAGLREDLRRLGTIDAAEPGKLRERLRALIEDQGGRIAARLAAAGRRYDPAALHEVRRRARRLRYASEIADAVFGRESVASKLWRELQNRLGEIHDRNMLAAWLAGRAERASRSGNVALAAAARGAARRSIRDARRRHRELLADGPASLVTDALRAMAPPDEPPEDRREGIVVPFPPAAAS